MDFSHTVHSSVKSMATARSACFPENDAASWGDTLRAIDRARKSLSWDHGDEMHRVKRINLCERKALERELDPIVMKYRDEAKEEQYAKRKLDQENARIERVNSAAQKFNIVSHTGAPSKITPPISRVPSSASELHLISYLPRPDHKQAPTLYSEDFYVSRFRPKRQSTDHVERQRQFNIVSNNFYEENTARQRSDYDRMREDTTGKYWTTHDFNPIIGEFYDERKEAAFREQREAYSQVQGLCQASRLPPR